MKLVRPLLILLILPLIILLLSYGAVKLLNMSNQPGTRLHVELDRDIVFPWENHMHAHIRLNLEQEQAVNKPAGNTNILLIVDNSPSMYEEPNPRYKLAKEVIINYIDNFATGGNCRMGIIFFDMGVTNQLPLTDDLDTLKKNFAQYRGMGDGTDFAPALDMAAQWLEKYKKENNFIVFLTDGGGEWKEPNLIYRERLLKNGTDVFMIGVGEGARYDVLREVIKDENGNFNPNRVLTCDDPLKLQVLFDHVGEEIGNVAGKQGEMLLPFAGKVFAWQKASPRDSEPDFITKTFLQPPETGDNPYGFPFPIVFAGRYDRYLEVAPITWGIVKPFYEDLRFSFLDLNTNVQILKSSAVPYVLNVTYWTLIMLFLPALLYLIPALLGRRKGEPLQKERIVFPDKNQVTPGVLPLQFVHDKANVEWIPTLVVGLGKTGRHILTHLKQNLSDAPGERKETVQLLSIDVAAAEVDGPQPDRVPGVVVNLHRETEIYIPEPALRNVKDKIEQYKNNTGITPDDPYTGLELNEYAMLPDQLKGLSGGTQRHAPLARTYLIKELEQGKPGKLFSMLKEKIENLDKHSQHSGVMQIIVVGNSNGGVGSALPAPLSVLLRRMADKITGDKKSTEINLFLVEDRKSYHAPKQAPVKNRILLDELDLLSQAGRVPFPYHLVPPDAENRDGILRGTLERRPHDNAYIFAAETTQPETDLFPRVADSALFFIERTARREARNMVEGVKKREGLLRKNEKTEIFSHISGRSVLYPTGLISAMLKLYFINDIFSDKIALPGLALSGGLLEIKKKGELADLLEHPLAKPVMERELGRQNCKWSALIIKRDIDVFNEHLADDTENFTGFLAKAISLLLNNGIFSLTALPDIIAQIKSNLTGIQPSALQAGESDEIDKMKVYLDQLEKNALQWCTLLKGNKNKKRKGLLETLREEMNEIETVKKELLSMKRSRIVLGLGDDTPEAYRPEALRKEWMSRWLGIRDKEKVYDQLKKRCKWTIVEKGLLKPGLTFRFFGAQTYTFESRADFQEEFIEKVHEVAHQFLVHLKEITVLELLSSYEKEKPEKYGKRDIAKRLHEDFDTENLYYLIQLPQPTTVRLDSEEENYVRLLKKELDEVRRVEEVAAYPPTSNQYRLYTLQISTMLRGGHREKDEEFKPLHITARLREETGKAFAKRFGIEVPPLLAIHYLVLCYPERFKAFVKLWLGGKIYRDDYDRLWKMQAGGKTIKLTKFKDEGLQEAAVRYVLNENCRIHDPGNIPPDSERLRQLETEVKRRTSIYCWMKLYMEKAQ
ncbi:MAG: VWA domain-containing protein [bacterium]|nr:VWA domain-containing protein [bacterium]